MAALLVKLRMRQLGHQLSRNPWMIVSLVIGIMTALGLLAALASGLVALRMFAPADAVTSVVIAGSVLTAGWWIGALVVGADDLMAPERFALLPVRAGRLLPGLVAAGAAGIGGIATTVALLVTLVGWSVDPLALLAGAILIPVALATCILGSRVVGGLAARWLAGRRTRDLFVIAGAILVTCSGLIISSLLNTAIVFRGVGAGAAAVADALAWTPIGAAYGVPAALASGSWGAAMIRLAIAGATLAALWLAARAMLAARLVAPIAHRGGGQIRGGAILDRMLPSTPAGAIAARVLRYRRRDPRHIINVVTMLLLPVLLSIPQLMSMMRGESAGLAPATILLPATVAVMVATIVQMDIAYDHDAITLHLAAGVRGVDDRAGRVLATAIIAVPATAILCVLACLAVGDWSLLPASLGASIGLVLVALGAGAVVGPWLPGRAPAPEANPLGRGSSGGVQSFAALAIMAPSTLIVGAPALGFGIAGIWMPWAGWASLACGLVIGAAAACAGVVWGGRILDRRWPEVLIAVTSEA
ncbi:hypothetical protein [Microbacterium karelineae]|uniref:hypothetical protein n=1 Tax=Microbacterium karelineae TaxID=2654283 RepID=UPI0012E9F5CC|nr:hypothetical protein [Microbacterium karelineae]